MTRKKYGLFAAMTVIGSIAISILMAELSFRALGVEMRYLNPLRSFHVQDPVYGYRGRANFQGRFASLAGFDVLVKHDNRGFRLHESECPTDDRLPRLFVYGDSYTWGWGVEQGEVFTDLLNQHHPEICVVNRGLNGSGTVQQYTIFENEDLPEARRGDFVLLMLCFNDFKDNYDRAKTVTAIIEDGSVRRIPPRKRFQSPFQSFIKRHSYVVNAVSRGSGTIKHLLAKWSSERKTNGKSIHEIEMVADDPQVIVTQYFIKQFSDRCQEAGLDFRAAIIPSASQYEQYHSQYVRILRELEVTEIDLLEGFRIEQEAIGDKSLFLEKDPHWNRQGHALVSRILASHYYEQTDPSRTIP